MYSKVFTIVMWGNRLPVSAAKWQHGSKICFATFISWKICWEQKYKTAICLSCWSKIPCGSPTISEIEANFHQDFLASTHSGFYQGQMDRGQFCWPNLSGETRLSKKEEEVQNCKRHFANRAAKKLHQCTWTLNAELKAGLLYSDNRSKLVHFEAQFFSMFKKALA